MRIKVLGPILPGTWYGDIVDVDDAKGRSFIDAGVAEEVVIEKAKPAPAPKAE